MIQPRRAPVRPRVISPASGEALVLEEEVQRLLDEDRTRVIHLAGPAGSGKTTALHHLAAVIPDQSRLALLPYPSLEQFRHAADHRRLVVYTGPPLPPAVSYRLAPWGVDDFIEYLLAVHKERCASVMARLPAADRACLRGVPQLWVVVLDQLARDDSIPDLRAALHRDLESQLPDTDAVERSRSGCLNVLALGGMGVRRAAEALAKPGFPKELFGVLRHEAVQFLLASERIAADLHAGNDCDYFKCRLPRELIAAAAGLVKHDAAALAHLNRLLSGPGWSHGMVASLLLAVDADWRPPPGCVPLLAGAYLSSARWRELRLDHTDLTDADLTAADLRQARLIRSLALGTVLRHAWMHAASVHWCVLKGADLTEADLSGAEGESACFEGACLVRANADGAVFRAASFARADLTGASFRGADLAQAILCDAKLAGADFAGANLTGSNLSGLRLREANVRGACLHGALMRNCDLEYVEWPGADLGQANLERALLTGTVMPGANFQGASLEGAYLAEVDWEGASLNGADLRGASFHMGSSRSGLVFSPIACEGSKTGFYTDEFDEQLYKAPEEIRKANLCGADLRGAKINDVDFYLVDVRGAKYDADQAVHLRRCGAILETRR